MCAFPKRFHYWSSEQTIRTFSVRWRAGRVHREGTMTTEYTRRWWWHNPARIRHKNELSSLQERSSSEGPWSDERCCYCYSVMMMLTITRLNFCDHWDYFGLICKSLIYLSWESKKQQWQDDQIDIDLSLLDHRRTRRLLPGCES